MGKKDFGWAIRQLKDGKRVQRAGWNGKKMYITLDRMCDQGSGEPLEFHKPFITMKTADGELQPGWLASQAFFKYEHLPVELQEISKPFHDLAHEMLGQCDAIENPAEMEAGLRKLLEAKDCFVRAALK